METREENLNETLKADGKTLKAGTCGNKKCYISLPISGRDIKRVRIDIRMMEHGLWVTGYEPYAPINDDTDITAPYSEHMGRDIAMLIECDAVVFMRGWEQSKGCMMEFEAAKIYGKEIKFV